jgi:hypothetical protein
VSTATTRRYEIAGGTVAGRSHVISGKPNQDAHAWLSRGEIVVAVVCDGCGSGAHSEVGAQIGARVCAARLGERLEKGAALDDGTLWVGVRDDLLGTLRDLASAMGGSLARAVTDYFLFTVVGVALVGDDGCVFAAGDGIAAVDGTVTRLGPFPGNEPPYVSYGLTAANAPGLSVVRAFSGARSILLGTDGAADLADLGSAVRNLSSFWEDDRYFRNPDAIRRQLALLNRERTKPVWEERRVERETGLLEDDTTIVMIRRAS